MGMKVKQSGQEIPEYISPKELAERWRCHPTTADRIIRREGLTRLYLGTGRNGMVRYIRKEVFSYEQSRQVGSIA